MVDTRDLKSLGQKCPCGFDSRLRHKRVSKDSSYSPSLHLFYSRKYTSVNPTRILGKKAVGTIYLTLVDREVPVLLSPAFRAKDLCSLVKTKNVKPTLHLIHELIASFLEYNVKEFLL